jgi:hypothetical protein
MILFTTQPHHSEKREWWKELANNEPDESNRRRDAVEESGNVSEKKLLTVNVNPIRIQITSELVRPPVDEMTPGYEGLVPFLDEKQSFLKLISQWLSKAPPINRIGFAAKLICPVSSIPEGYQLLDRMLQTVDVDPNSSDFLYRVNRKTHSKCEPVNTLINQLTTWATQKPIRQQLTLVGDKLTTQPTSGEAFGTFVELDINTDQHRLEPYPSETLNDLCAELTALAQLIVTHGDRRE